MHILIALTKNSIDVHKCVLIPIKNRSHQENKKQTKKSVVCFHILPHLTI